MRADPARQSGLKGLSNMVYHNQFGMVCKSIQGMCFYFQHHYLLTYFLFA